MNSQTFLEIPLSPAFPHREFPGSQLKNEKQAVKRKENGRRFKALLICVSCLSASSVQAEIVAHYKFDGSLKDETGQHEGELRDPQDTPEFLPGKIGDALSIDAAGNSVECANPTTFDMSRDFTLSAWVKTAKGGEVIVVYKGPRDAFSGKARQFELYGGGGLGGNGIFFYTADSGAYGTSFESSHNIIINDDNWHHVAVTYSASTTPHFTLFMDGIGKVGTDPGRYFGADFLMQADASDENQVLRVGGRDEGGAYTTFIGLMDDVQFYNRPLSREQVKFLFDNPGQVVAPPENVVLFTQPIPSQVVGEGTNVTLNVEAEGRAPLTYQWKFNGVDLPGQTSASLTLTNVAPSQSGNYTVTISNAAGAVTSNPGYLLVLAGGVPLVDLHMYAGVTLFGLPASRYEIQSGEVVDQATNWLTLATVTLPNPSTPYLYFDVQSTNYTKRFYRAVLVP